MQVVSVHASCHAYVVRVFVAEVDDSLSLFRQSGQGWRWGEGSRALVCGPEDAAGGRVYVEE